MFNKVQATKTFMYSLKTKVTLCKLRIGAANRGIKHNFFYLENFNIQICLTLSDVIGESPTGNGVATHLRSLRKSSRLRQEFAAGRQVSRVTDNSTAPSVAVSMRHAFIPFKGRFSVNELQCNVGSVLFRSEM